VTTAPTTAFVKAQITGPGGHHLWIDGNQKITAGNGTFASPRPNAFSLVQVKDCPGSTPACRASCYVHNLEKHAPAIHRLYAHNSRTIRMILDGLRCSSLDWARTMADWITANCAGGFRWHVSGDVFSEAYAQWIVQVCRRSPGVRHWIYTRSFDLVEELNQATNLVVNLSADADNYDAAERLAAETGLRVCYMTTNGTVPGSLQPGDVIFPDYSLRGNETWRRGLPLAERRMICPVDFFGKSESIRCGVCRKCMK